MPKETIVIIRDAKYDRVAYMKLVGNTVIFDDSDCEYGPTKFDISILKEVLKKHEEDG